MIPFNKSYFTGKEYQYIGESLRSGKISGDGDSFTLRNGCAIIDINGANFSW